MNNKYITLFWSSSQHIHRRRNGAIAWFHLLQQVCKIMTSKYDDQSNYTIETVATTTVLLKRNSFFGVKAVTVQQTGAAMLNCLARSLCPGNLQ
jgi:hypothetical protein